MNANDEYTRSIWMKEQPVAQAGALDQDLTCTTVIVGSGIAGLSTAYELAKAGHNVVVLARGAIAGGMPARTTAHLDPDSDDGISALAKMRGEVMAGRFQESQAAAVDRIEEIVATHKISCNFRRLAAYLFPRPG